MCSQALQLLAVGAAAASAVPAAPYFPTYSESFTVHTRESNPVHGVVVRQTIASDASLERSMMLAEGSMVHGVLQQITRCDIHPAGWFVQLVGADALHLQCQNQTRTCQWSRFWAPPPLNASMADDSINGTACTRWEWWEAGEQMAFWGTKDTPLRSGKIATHHAGWSTWTIDWLDFKAAAPALDAFAPLPGAKCPPASSPPLMGRRAVAGVGAGAPGAALGGGGPGFGALVFGGGSVL